VKIINKINWVFTWLALTIAKRSLRSRIEGAGADFLQPVTTTGVEIFNRLDFILDYCKNKKIVHVGFTDYPFTQERIQDKTLLHLQLLKGVTAMVGVDIEQDAINVYSSQTGDANVYFGDITDSYPTQAISFNPDIILIGEVLEHLKNPYTAIDVLYNSFASGTKILVTVPNYTSLDSLAASLNKTESIHPHHYWYYSPYTLQKLFDQHRFKMEQLHFGMYYQPRKNINGVMKHFLYNADCIIAVFTINKI
jgi:hypothetical protein